MASKKFTAKTADKHILYEKSVQNPDYDAVFVEKLYRRIRKKPAKSMREDFCGTFTFCCEWVKLKPDFTAVGVDIHKPTLEWGRKNNLSSLEEADRERVTILNGNVLDFTDPRVDMLCAFNFSYYLFKTRPELLSYFKTARQALNDDGVMLLDAFGGSESFLVLKERRKCDGFTYVWEHADYNPLTAEMLCKIHFEFSDGSAMRNAFTYSWRLWTLAEIRELLYEAGFSDVQVFWEGTDNETGSGNGIFRKTTKGEACQSWIAYIAALK